MPGRIPGMPSPMHAPLLHWVAATLGSEAWDDPATHVETVQSLWSGYGSILRVSLAGGSAGAAHGEAPGEAPTSVIVKQVHPPAVAEHPRGWSGRASHERKLRSYEVERAFYGAWHPGPVAAHRTARCFAAETYDGGFRFLLEYLDGAGFTARRQQLTEAELRECLRWLAAFHGAHLNRDPKGLWPVGTYWHLATRQEELAAMGDDQLRDAAPKLDALLRDCPYRTLVHGDAKVANFCFARRTGPHRRWPPWTSSTWVAAAASRTSPTS